jgi:hypothetical protein
VERLDRNNSGHHRVPGRASGTQEQRLVENNTFEERTNATERIALGVVTQRGTERPGVPAANEGGQQRR